MPLNWNIQHFTEIDSTSTWLKNEQANLPDFTVAVADFQTAGRGRLGRRWVAPPGSALMFSMLLRPNWPVEQGGWLVMIAGLAAANTLRNQSKLPIQLKWPNDIVFEKNGELCKLGGILQEAETVDGRITQVIIGIGLNVNLDADDLPQATHTTACSLKSLSGHLFDRNALLEDLLSNFETLYKQCAAGKSPQAQWERQLVTLGKRVTATMTGANDQSQKIDGIADHVDEWGRLVIKTDEHELKAVSAGDVTLRTD